MMPICRTEFCEFFARDPVENLETVSNSTILASDSVIIPVTNLNQGILGECNRQVCNSCSKAYNRTNTTPLNVIRGNTRVD